MASERSGCGGCLLAIYAFFFLGWVADLVKTVFRSGVSSKQRLVDFGLYLLGFTIFTVVFVFLAIVFGGGGRWILSKILSSTSALFPPLSTAAS